MDADYTNSDDVEIGLNREVDHVISSLKDEPEAPYEEPMEQQEIVDRISRIAGEIQQVIPLILPKRNMIAPGAPEELEIPQDPVLAQAAKNLLIAQIEKLKKLVGQLD
jgi:hypothetical protein